MLAVVSCQKKGQKSEGPEPTRFEQAMTEKDTTAVKALIDKFFGYAIAKDYAESAAMLYRNDVGTNGTEPLDNDGMQKVINTLKVFQPIDYSIEYIKFNSYKKNEVLCNIIMSRTEDGRPLATSKMFFKPVHNMNGWHLCVMDTKNGDKGVVDPHKRDSVKRNFDKKEAAKAAAKAAADSAKVAQ